MGIENKPFFKKRDTSFSKYVYLSIYSSKFCPGRTSPKKRTNVWKSIVSSDVSPIELTALFGAFTHLRFWRLEGFFSLKKSQPLTELLWTDGWVEVWRMESLVPFVAEGPVWNNTPWKINGWKLQITHLERKMIWTKPPWLCSMLIFRGVFLEMISLFVPQFSRWKIPKKIWNHQPVTHSWRVLVSIDDCTFWWFPVAGNVDVFA